MVGKFARTVQLERIPHTDEFKPFVVAWLHNSNQPLPLDTVTKMISDADRDLHNVTASFALP